MAKLTSVQRKRLPDSSFAIDGKQRRYPINDKSHARNALARVSQHGTPSEKSRVRAAVRKKYPSIEISQDAVHGAKMQRHRRRAG